MVFRILTEEQLAIVNSTEKVVMAIARSGAGKSYTAVRYAKKKSLEGHKILYIVFNKSLQKSAEDDFKGVNNVTVSTIHSLAYKGTQAFRYKDKLTGSYNAKDLADDLNMRNFNDAGYLYYLWNKYLTSDYKNLDDFCENHVKGNKQYKTKMIHKLEELWKLKLNQSSDVKIEHNFYLKLFHIDGFKLIDDYTCLIADEVNDYNHLMKDMFINSKCEYKLALGDPQQTIYSFNGVAEDVFGEIAKATGGTKYPLSVSFRIGSENSMVCNHIYNDMSDGKEFVIFGENKNQKVYIKSHLEPKDFDKSCVLSRTNGALLDYAISGAKAGKWLGFIGGINNYKFDFYVNLYFFSRGIKQKDQFFNKFRDWAELLHYTEESEDIELLSAINIVKRHNCKLPDYVKLIKEMTVKDTNKCDMLLSTVHRIKGATISVPVFIGEDLVNLEKLQAQLDILDYENAPESHLERFYKDCEEELNVLYVALTRSNNCLYLNKDLTDYCRKKGIL